MLDYTNLMGLYTDPVLHLSTLQFYSFILQILSSAGTIVIDVHTYFYVKSFLLQSVRILVNIAVNNWTRCQNLQKAFVSKCRPTELSNFSSNAVLQ